jgi:hypothetical protein
MMISGDDCCRFFLSWGLSIDNMIRPYHAPCAQGFNGNGDLLWPPDPVDIGNSFTRIAHDNSGGVFTLTHWKDSTGMHILGSFYVQHLHADGSLVNIGFLDSPLIGAGRRNKMIIPDGYTGAIVAWDEDTDESSPYNPRIRVQRILNDDTLLWETGGTTVCDSCELMTVTGDGSGGVIVVYRDEAFTPYAQRLDAAGTPQWGGGIEICTESRVRLYYSAITSGAGGAIVTWIDDSFPVSAKDVYIQKVDPDGSLPWGTGAGVPVCTAAGDQQEHSCVTDGSGGAIVVWRDPRSGDYDIYAQRIDSDGNNVWATDGIPIKSGSGNQRNPRVCDDGAGGALIAWVDEYRGDGDIYCRAVGGDGGFLWGPGSVPVCTDPGLQEGIVMAKHCGGGAVIAWLDYQNSDCGEIYIDWFTQPSTDSPTPPLAEEIFLEQNRPNPFNPATTISFSIRSAGDVSLRIYDSAGRLVRNLIDGHRSEGSHSVEWDGTNDSGARVSSGVYHYRLTAGGEMRSRKMVLLR